MAKFELEISNNNQFRELIEVLANSTTLSRALSFNGHIFVKMLKAEFETPVNEFVPDGMEPIPCEFPNQDFSQFYNVRSDKYPNMRYVAVGKTTTAYLNKVLKTGAWQPIEPWRFYRWYDVFGPDNFLIEVPMLDAVEV